MDVFHDSLRKILEFAFLDRSNSIIDTKNFLKNLSTNKLQMINLPENTIFIENTKELDNIYILVKGTTYVVNYTVEGRRIIADTLHEVQIFGLIEAINKSNYYRGTVISLSNSLLVKIKKEDFLKAIDNDITIASFIIKYLANFSIHTMKLSEYKTTISPYENLIIYLYNKVIGKNLPVRIKDNKSFIADSLQINKRTLFRYLNKLTEEEIITRDHQDIIISEGNFKKIERIFNSIK